MWIQYLYIGIVRVRYPTDPMNPYKQAKNLFPRVLVNTIVSGIRMNMLMHMNGLVKKSRSSITAKHRTSSTK